MAANVLTKRKEPSPSPGWARSASVGVLYHRYVTATAAIGIHFPLIDEWLTEHDPDLWQQIRQEDDELFRLRELGIPEETYQERLDTLIALCKQAEQLYYEARPTELSLPPLAEGELVAVYFELANGSLLKMGEEED